MAVSLTAYGTAQGYQLRQLSGGGLGGATPGGSFGRAVMIGDTPAEGFHVIYGGGIGRFADDTQNQALAGWVDLGGPTSIFGIIGVNGQIWGQSSGRVIRINPTTYAIEYSTANPTGAAIWPGMTAFVRTDATGGILYLFARGAPPSTVGGIYAMDTASPGSYTGFGSGTIAGNTLFRQLAFNRTRDALYYASDAGAVGKRLYPSGTLAYQQSFGYGLRTINGVAVMGGTKAGYNLVSGEGFTSLGVTLATSAIAEVSDATYIYDEGLLVLESTTVSPFRPFSAFGKDFCLFGIDSEMYLLILPEGATIDVGGDDAGEGYGDGGGTDPGGEDGGTIWTPSPAPSCSGWAAGSAPSCSGWASPSPPGGTWRRPPC